MKPIHVQAVRARWALMFVILLASSTSVLAQAVVRSPTNGPYAVGYRVINHRDGTRRTAPARDFEGRANTGDLRVPMQFSVWYPAKPGGTRMRMGEYAAIAAKRETLGAVSEADIVATSAGFRTGLTFVTGADLPQHTADSIRDLRGVAVRNAAPVTGRFPAVIGGLGGPGSASGLGEYLASHGYVVITVPNLFATASQEVTRRAAAMETYTRNLETAQSIVLDLPFVDPRHIALIGTGPHGIAALMHQMRNMSADAIVSLDGQELPAGSATVLREFPHFDASRIRVPYLAFGQDNAPSPALVFSDSLLRDFKYADRSAYIVRDMEHIHLMGSVLMYPQIGAEQRLGYDFIWRTVRSFLDAHLKDDPAGRAFMRRSAVENGFPASLAKLEWKRPALPAIPNADEIEAIAMTGNVERLRQLHQRARASDSTVRMFSTTALNLFAFRYSQRGEHDTAIGFNTLAVEAFPGSATAANNLGNSYRTAGKNGQAIEAWEKALRLIDGDTQIAPAERATSRATIEQKIRALRTPR